jgi:phosphate-selective porin OprO/OprP
VDTEQVQLRLSGRLIGDAGLFSGRELEQATGVELEDDIDLRQARLGLDGSLAGELSFRLDLELAEDDPELRDAWIQKGGLALGALRIGHFREPLGLEANTARPQLTFAERAAPVHAFTPGRSLGLMLHDTWADDRAHWAVGAFLPTNSRLERAGSDHSFTARCTCLPLRELEGERLVHLGVGYSHRDTDDGGVGYSASGEIDLLDPLLGTGTLDADSVGVLGVEAAWVHGPFSAQGELLHAALDVEGGQDADLHGGYVQMSAFLSGESRPYDPSRGAFARIEPATGWLEEGGLGAWEIAARWSWADLDDGAATADVIHNLALGANWYLDRKTRLMLGWVHSDLKQADASADLLLLRLQLML